MYFILLYKSTQFEEHENETRKFKIFDSINQKMIYECNIQNPALIGRLKSGLFDIVDGHIYFNNNVIKIRYELINSKNHYGEDQIFNFYNDIFNIERKELRIKSTTPINSLKSHRFAYIVSDY